ncbi:MAG TPA: Holliday junction resolvase-like protein [Spirochaetia bacterium]|nr:Holliday junction resolvase-like protein [Spirochaetia bacterium]
MLSDSPAVAYLALLALAAILALLAVILVWRAERRRSSARIEQLLNEREQDLQHARRESVERSRSSLKGQIAEQMAPLLPGFQYEPADARFLGDPIDYVVFKGYTGVRDQGAEADDVEIVLLEVKQGRSALSPTQRIIARSVEEGRVRFEICRILDDGNISTETWRPTRGRLS